MSKVIYLICVCFCFFVNLGMMRKKVSHTTKQHMRGAIMYTLYVTKKLSCNFKDGGTPHCPHHKPPYSCVLLLQAYNILSALWVSSSTNGSA
ncbi:hypothetical protein FKM82_026220 [Ascaphus truei]